MNKRTAILTLVAFSLLTAVQENACATDSAKPPAASAATSLNATPTAKTPSLSTTSSSGGTTPGAKPTELDSHIGPPDFKKWSKKNGANRKHWRNPYISIDANLIIRVRWANTNEKTVSIDQLQRFLLDLPVSAWPFGRVIELQGVGLADADKMEKRKESMEQMKEILSDLHLTILEMPTA
ncbi:MAG TPA: hypothetical protein V6C81_30770 [Planktothrix sp.]